jgi:hypothetical protein
MTYAVIITVKLDIDTSAAHRREVMEEQVAPRLLELDGFQLATWMNDGNGGGVTLVEFDTKEHADDALVTLIVNGPEVISSGVYEVEFEASP